MALGFISLTVLFSFPVMLTNVKVNLACSTPTVVVAAAGTKSIPVKFCCWRQWPAAAGAAGWLTDWVVAGNNTMHRWSLPWLPAATGTCCQWQGECANREGGAPVLDRPLRLLWEAGAGEGASDRHLGLPLYLQRHQPGEHGSRRLTGAMAEQPEEE